MYQPELKHHGLPKLQTSFQGLDYVLKPARDTIVYDASSSHVCGFHQLSCTDHEVELLKKDFLYLKEFRKTRKESCFFSLTTSEQGLPMNNHENIAVHE